ncbi:hypothetical protein BH11PLA2_BH11PLA2_13260 [soil metagenome]
MLRMLPILVVILVAAAPSSDDSLRDAQAAYNRGEFELALKHLDAARVATADPGLVSYQRGCVLAAMQNWTEAEKDFSRTLEDADGSRRTSAFYNRGICLLNMAESPSILQLAIASFQQCLTPELDETTRSDVQHNIEVAKIRWLKWQAKQSKPTSPEESVSRDPANKSDTPEKANDGSSNNTQAKATPRKDPKAKPGTNGATKTAAQPLPGAGTLPVIKDTSVLTPMTPEQTTAYLDQAAGRLLQQRRNNEHLRSGPERPNVRDW